MNKSAEVPAFSATRVSKRLGSYLAIVDVDMEIARGDSVAIIGPNGAGKTTLLKLLTGLLRPTAGSVLVDGRPPREVRANIGFSGHDSYLYPYLTVLENLAFYARLYGADETGALALLDELALGHRKDALAGTLSAGETQRVSLARALIHRPAFLILDEPTSALDEAAVASLESVCRSDGRTILLATHDVHRTAALTDRAIVLKEGRMMPN